MIQLTFHREAVCMGDDVQNGTYHIEMPDDADLGDLMDVILHTAAAATTGRFPSPARTAIG